MTNEVGPFRALHYDLEKIDEIGLCLAQPYDVISGEQQDAYYEFANLSNLHLSILEHFHVESYSFNGSNDIEEYLNRLIEESSKYR